MEVILSDFAGSYGVSLALIKIWIWGGGSFWYFYEVGPLQIALQQWLTEI